MGLALVVVKKHARRAMQLRDYDALRSVDHKSTVIGHQRHLTKIDFLLTDFLHRLYTARRFLVTNFEIDKYPQRGRIGQTAELAFLDIECRHTETIAHIL